jgi:hypothetical protein
LLVLAGLVALLANLGAISVDQLDRLLDLWPLVLVAIGIRLVAGGLLARPLASIVTWAVVLLMLLAAVGYVAAGSPAVATQRQSASAPLGGADSGRLEVTGGAFDAKLSAGDTGADLYRATILTAPGRHVDVVNEGSGVRIEFPSGPSAFGLGLGFTRTRREVEIMLSDRVPWTVTLEGGALRATGDLSRGKLAHIGVAGGASHLELSLPPPNGTVSIQLEGGATDAQLHRPSGTEARVSVAGGASTIEADGRRISALSSDAEWSSPGFAAAADRYEIRAEGGASRLRIDTR